MLYKGSYIYYTIHSELKNPKKSADFLSKAKINFFF